MLFLKWEGQHSQDKMYKQIYLNTYFLKDLCLSGAVPKSVITFNIDQFKQPCLAGGHHVRCCSFRSKLETLILDMQIVTHPHSICIVKTTCPCWERSPVNLAFKSCALKAGLWPGTGYSLDGLLTQQLQKQVGAAPKATGCTLSALTSLWKKAPL